MADVAKLDVNALDYPVLCIKGESVDVASSPENLTTCTKVSLDKGYYNGLLIVESGGLAHRVVEARKLHGVGPFGGYNIFFNQRLRVELLAGPPETITVDGVRAAIFYAFEHWHGWQSRGDYALLVRRIKRARSIRELMTILAAKSVQDVKEPDSADTPDP